jgi:glycosyltransferase involved in cell wall biosynthesis
LSILEANSKGIPVIASNLSAIRELIVPGKNGDLFQVKDKEDLSKKITDMFKDEIGMKENSIRVSQKYSLINYLNKLNKTYNELK